MPTFHDFLLAKAQAVLFTPEARFEARKVLGYLLGEWPDTFPGDPLTLPNVEGMPPQVPRVVWGGEDALIRLQVAPTRVDLFFQHPDPNVPFDLTGPLQLATKFFHGYVRATGDRAGRLACVLARVAFDEQPAVTLAAHFCKPRWLEDPLNRPSGFEVHAHKIFPMGAFQVNSWVRCKTGALVGETPHTGNRPIILVEQDFNTVPDEASTRAFSDEEIAGFFSSAPSEFDTVLRRYFPEESTQ